MLPAGKAGPSGSVIPWRRPTKPPGNGIAGQAWVDSQALLDQVLEPFAELLVEAAPVVPGSRVLDVGCGTGATTLAMARRLGAGGSCVGIDISAPMITAARARADVRAHTPRDLAIVDGELELSFRGGPARVDAELEIDDDDLPNLPLPFAHAEQRGHTKTVDRNFIQG